MKTVDYYKKAVRLAEGARESIEKANADYEHSCVLAKNAVDAGILGEQGYKQQIEEAKYDRDCRIEGALCRIDEVGAAYSAEMAELGRLDGSRIDENAMKLLNSGLQLTNEDWQELANNFKDNHVMTRILKERYNANKPQNEGDGFTLGQKGTGLTFVQFGQSPQDRQEVFEKFTKTLRNSCTYKHMPSAGGRDFASRHDYHNFLVKDSLQSMKPFGDESFDNVNEDFPVEFVQHRPTIF